ncbi:MAG: SDR family NAD(P)-dependent oxidoreductase [Cyanobacteria bacterium P01_A01_bin.40]
MNQTNKTVNELSSSQRLLVALDEAVEKLESAERSKSEPIAIVGMGCRFPRGANNPEAFWQLLRDGIDGISKVPEQRWSLDQYYDSNPDATGKMYTRYGGFLEQVDLFDPNFFGISPREAESIDPQQRLLLEVSWSALENAGQIPEELKGSQTGVFIGVTTNDYARLLVPSNNTDHIDTYYLTGNPLNAMAGRLSYVLGLQGPSMAVDTACSSSLVSIHLACQSLRNQECNLAFAGGVNLILSPENTVALCKAKMIARDGRCKTFDAAADGFVRGEGCGVILLKRLSDAVIENDNILALIRGSAINQDGFSSGFTVPNKAAQQAVINQALDAAKIDPAEVDYVQAHGTGTSLGDPIEIRALAGALGKERSLLNPLKIGSIKTNIGHLESAAGVAGLIATVLALRHRQIPPHLHLKKLNPFIDWEHTPVTVPTKLTPWSKKGKARLAGVSSFGASGTNAHIILEESPDSEKTSATIERPLHLLTLSAKTEKALVDLASQYKKYVASNPLIELKNVCFSANTGRSHFQHRLAIVAATHSELERKLAEFQVTKTNKIFPTNVAFMFTGQGSQYVGMARELYQTQPSFRQTLEQCDRILQSYTEQSLLSVLYPDEGDSSDFIHQTEYTQPALFAVEYALAKLWMSWGIKPDVVIGHSLGEYVAATIARVFSLEDALMLVAKRAKLMQALPASGTMLAILADEETVVRIIKHYSADVNIAAVNGNENVVISGKSKIIESLATDLKAQGIEFRPLNVSHAFHSQLMQPMLAEFEQVANQVSYSTPQIKIISNITGDLIGKEIATAQYWCRHIINPVRFKAGVEKLKSIDINVLLEIGVKPTLLNIARSILPSSKQPRLWLPSLHSKQSDWQQILESLAQLYLHGAEIDWQVFDRDYPRRQVQLPTYAFQRKRYWFEPTQDRKSNNKTKLVFSTIITDLLDRGDTARLNQLLDETEEPDSTKLTSQKAIEKLVQKHQQQLKAASIRDLFYEIRWQPKPFQEEQVILSEKPQNWLILADSKGYGDSLSKLLTAKGHQCSLVYTGNTYKKIESNTWQLRANNNEDWKILLTEITQELATPIEKIIHFWSLDFQPTLKLNLDSLLYSQILGCGSVLTLIQTLVELDQKLPRLWLITKGAIAFKQSSLSVAQSSLWGLGNTIALEHPAFWGGAIDLDSTQQNQSKESSAIFRHIKNADLESKVVFRSDKRYVSRLVKSSLKANATTDIQLKVDATYLITGGLGALGLQLAWWMAEKGAKHIVLLSRSEPSSTARSSITQIEKTGIRVIVFQADVSSLEDLSQVLTEVQNSLPPLRGIIHAAGILKDGILQQQTWDNFTQVMKPKVEGAWNLHLATQDLALDFLVFFSSAASLLGSPGQGNYGAANVFMDALAHYRRSQNLPALSVNWGPWANVGMAANLESQFKTRIKQQGINSLSSEQGLQALEQLMLQDSPQVGVFSIDWSDFRQSLGSKKLTLFLAELIDDRGRRSQASPAFQRRGTCDFDNVKFQQFSIEQQQFLQKLKSAPKKERQQLLIRLIQEQVVQVLKFDRSTQLPDPQLNFFDMGIDSLMAVELKNQLEENLGQTFPSTLIFNNHNIEALAEHLSQQLFFSELSSDRGMRSSASPDMRRSVAPLFSRRGTLDQYGHYEPKTFQHNTNEPIAIIGMSCRFPGANDPEAFWQLLETGSDLVSDVPINRWNVDKFYESNPNVPGKMYTRSGGFINDIDRFDPYFFGISPREAVSLDPQQRLLLEVSWSALENAGQVTRQLAGSQTGVFIGIGQNDYARLGIQLNDPSIIDAYSGTGNSFSFAAGRLSYILGLQGPSLAIDTACSSSLVAIHQACQSLQTGECDLALAGGVQLMISPDSFIFLSQARALSPDGRCKPFDASADGFGRGEGCGVIVLKRLSDAIADKENILATVRGSAVNHDGASSGLTVPNGMAQQQLIRQALKTARVEPNEVTYLETHGTGTALGDPIEAEALGAVFQSKSLEQPLVIGSVKANIGHLEAAAGIAGLIKVVLALQHQAIPPQINFETPNPLIDWDNLPFKIPTELSPWDNNFQTRIAGVSSFGISGTNAHIVVEEAPELLEETNLPILDRPLHLLTLSAKTESAFKHLSDDYLNYLTVNPDIKIEDLCFSANTGRESFAYRLAVLAESTEQLQQYLSPSTSESNFQNVFWQSSPDLLSRQLKIAFMFTGQGSQYVGMARELYQTQPSFRQTIEQCDRILQQYLEQSLLSILYSGDNSNSSIHQTEYTQPALFAVEYALAKLWQEWGVQPDLVMGHSLGEYVAATIAGVFSLEDALKLVSHRAKLMQALPQTGTMLAVLADEPTVEEAIESYSNEVNIAAVNSKENIVISGTIKAIELIASNFETQGIEIRPLKVSHAFHSALMQPMLEEFEQVAHQISYSSPKIELISNVTGGVIGEEIATAEYWCRHIVSPVQFKAGVETLAREKINALIEIGAKPTLLGMVRSILSSSKQLRLWLPSLHPKQSDWQQLLESLAQLYLHGAEIDWQTFDRDYPRRRILLPTYPFQRQRYWFKPGKHQQSNAGAYSTTVKTSILNVLDRGNPQSLVELLENAQDFSPEQKALLPQISQALIDEHQRQLNFSSKKEIFKNLYRIKWQLAPQIQSTNKAFSEPGNWLIFADRSGYGESLAKCLRAEHQNCLLVYASNIYSAEKTNNLSVDPSNPEHFQLLFQDLPFSTKSSLKGIIHCWNIDTNLTEDSTVSDLEYSQTQGCGSLLHLVQAIAADRKLASSRLWLITREAVAVKKEQINIAQSSAWGFAKVISLEHPNIWGGAIDLDSKTSIEKAATQILFEIKGDRKEELLALRKEERYAARLVPQDFPLPSKQQVNTNSSYLITGGLGSLGLKVAQSLVKQGAKHLVLLGRQGLPKNSKSAQQVKAIQVLKEQGAEIAIEKADVADSVQMSSLFARLTKEGIYIKGIIHAAGVENNQFIQESSLQMFQSTIRPKVSGAWLLHQLTKDMELDFFICFSSISSVWGSGKQANYAAANSFLDALAHYRQALGLPGLSINWGPWAGGGMTTEESQRLLSRIGVESWQPNQAVEIFTQLLNSNVPQITAVKVNWDIFKAVYQVTNERTLFTEINIQHQDEISSPALPARLTTQLQDILPARRYDFLVDFLRRKVAEILGWTPSQLPGEQEGFAELGMDSLTAVELKNNLERELGFSLSTTIAFNYPNVSNLANYLLAEVDHLSQLTNNLSEQISENSDRKQNTNDNTVALEKMSEDDLALLLDEELENISDLTF